MRFTKSILGVAALMGALMASGAAMAGPTTTVDGVTIPVGMTPGGYLIDAESSFETLITGPGQNFYGAFKVQSIQDNVSNDTYQYGQNSTYLYGVFTGFTVDTVTPPTATTAGTILLKGGQISYYVSPTDNFTVSSGSAATDMADDSTGTLWLSATPEVLDAAGDTLQITIPAGATDADFTGASAIADLDVNAGAAGGAAGFNFTTGTFTNPYSGRPGRYRVPWFC